MQRKIDGLLKKYNSHLATISGSAQNYIDFLDIAAHFYKYNFCSQVLIAAQKPTATACAKFDFWKEIKSPVKRGSKGIATINDRKEVVYVFDVKDTVGLYTPVLWNLSDSEKEFLMEKHSASNLSELFLQYILPEISQMEPQQNMFYNMLLTDTCLYKCLSRCNVSKAELHDMFSFNNILQLNIKEFQTMGVIATAVVSGVINKINLEIKKTVESEKEESYNPIKEESGKIERSEKNDGYEVQRNRRNILSGHRSGSRSIDDSGIVRKEEAGIYTGIQPGTGNGTYADERAERVSSEDTGRSRRDGGQDRDAAESGKRDKRRVEEHGHAEMGSGNESDTGSGEGDSVSGTDIRLEYYDQETEGKSLPFFNFNNMNKVLLSVPLNDSYENISKYIKLHQNEDINEYIRDLFNNEDKITVDGEEYGYKKYQNVILVYTMENGVKTTQAYCNLGVIASYFKEYVITDSLCSYEEYKDIPQIINQAVIDLELLHESSYSEGKFRIYKYFQENTSTVDRINFLKNEYGVGGHSFFNSANGFVDYSSKGIEIKIGGILDYSDKVLLDWKKVENRISDLISNDLYLSEREKHIYVAWLSEYKNKQRERLKSIGKYTPVNGDDIYIGDKKYQIMDISNGQVKLFDYELPLINKILEIDDFKAKISENPLNEKLLKSRKGGTEEAKGNLGERKQDTPSIYKIGNNDIITSGGKKSKYDVNIKAIKLVKEIIKSGRKAADDEKNILVKYIGWGGLSEAFDVKNDGWSKEYSELKNLLNEKEYEQAMESTLTAFYTPPEIIDGIYAVLDRNHVQFSNILEPACATGNFIGRLPEKHNGVKIYGVEKDLISGQIASLLYPEADIIISGYENTDFSDEYFDVAVGNVPFGNFKVNDRRYNNRNFLIHDYFFAKTLDKLKPNGVMALITSKGTLDKTNSSFRKYLAKRAELLGAIRLPNHIFKSYTETVVTSDILFLQKRPQPIEVDEPWIHLGTNNNGVVLNQYFIDNPEMVIGDMINTTGKFGSETTCTLKNKDSFAERY